MPVASIESGDLAKVWEFRTLGRSRDAEARSLLEKIAKQVQPVMRKRKWRVMLLSEFCPGNPALLGLNIGAGQEIRIRLRQPGRESEFIPYEALVGTMLHELTHNEHGPHDAKFYKLLDEITKECEDLMVKGISGTGQGFDAPGTRLGRGYSHNPPLSNLRQAALAAAEKRVRTGTLMPSGPRRLGGDSVIMQALSPIQAAAMAAERRQRDDIWCAAPDTIGEDGLHKAQERESANAPTLPSKKDTGAAGQESQSGLGMRTDSKSWQTADKGVAFVGNFVPEVPQSSSYQGHDRVESSSAMWECSVCTLLNPALAMVCGACSTVRSGEDREKPAMWSCKFCTLENTILLDNCAACSQWRYSHGAPVTARAPYVGT